MINTQPFCNILKIILKWPPVVVRYEVNRGIVDIGHFDFAIFIEINKAVPLWVFNSSYCPYAMVVSGHLSLILTNIDKVLNDQWLRQI